MKRSAKVPDTEPTEKKFQIPSEGLHSFQITDVIQDVNNDDIVFVTMTVCSSVDNGLTLRNRTDLNPDGKGFWATRLLLKAIKESYKGAIEIDTDMWIGKTFVATVKHNEYNGKTYANIAEYMFDVNPEVCSKNEPSEPEWVE